VTAVSEYQISEYIEGEGFTREAILNTGDPETLGATDGVAVVCVSDEDGGDVLAAVVNAEQVDGGLRRESLCTSGVNN
jgi:hypothetical protein